MEQKIFAANWKMNKTIAESKDFAISFKKLVSKTKHKVIIFPPFLSISELAKNFEKTQVIVGAQNMHQSENGAFTGETSASMLIDVGAKSILVGHSERRQFFGETNQTINLKIKTALAKGLSVVFCIGETLFERDSNQTKNVLKKQIFEGLDGINESSQIVVAYEPVWAIGTGKTPSIEMIEQTHFEIKTLLKSLFGVDFKVPALYGGSVNEKNFIEIVNAKNVDGALVGGASLSAEKFAQMVNSK